MPSDRETLTEAVLSGLRTLAGATPAAISRDNTDTRAAWWVAIPQAAAADGAPRGVKVRALSALQRTKAEIAAHRWVMREMGPPPAHPLLREIYLQGYTEAVERRQVIEEVAQMVVEPPDMPVRIVEGWSDGAVQLIHSECLRLEPLPAEVVATALAQLHGAPPPAAPTGEPDQPEPPVDELASDPE
jgi:hypothetical protein